MDAKGIELANSVIKTTPISGKDYAEVNQRIKGFRLACPNGAIETELISLENGVAIFKATVKDETGKILGTGTAYEKEGNGFINKTSYIENCETSAVGRALGMCGIGIDVSLASYEEVANAKVQQAQDKPKSKEEELAELKTRVIKFINAQKFSGEEIKKIAQSFGKTDSVAEWDTVTCKTYIKFIEDKGGTI